MLILARCRPMELSKKIDTIMSGWKQGKLSGSCLSTIYDFGVVQFSQTLMSDEYSRIFLTKQSHLNVSEIWPVLGLCVQYILLIWWRTI